MELVPNMSVVADKNAKLLHIIIDYSNVVGQTKKVGKDVYANAYYVKLNENFTLNCQLLGNKKTNK